jgi:hypothetical protein
MPTTRGPRPDPPFVYGVPLVKDVRRGPRPGPLATLAIYFALGAAFGTGFALALRVLG